MLRYGLTGGIASGKSTVAAILRELGFPVLEADRMAHQVIEPRQPAYNEVRSIFGDSILSADRRIERRVSEAEARRRIAAQMPVADKLALASEKIDCSGSLEETRRQVEAFATKLPQSSPGR